MRRLLSAATVMMLILVMVWIFGVLGMFVPSTKATSGVTPRATPPKALSSFLGDSYSDSSLVQEVVLPQADLDEPLSATGEPGSKPEIAKTGEGSLELQSSSIEVALLGADFNTSIAEVQAYLLPFSDLTVVDIIDVRYSTPSLATLLSYDSVLVWSNYWFNDSVALGNVLADYVDSGGGVVLATFVWYGPTYNLEGRMMTDYSPFVQAGDNLYSYANLSWYNALHPIMTGVSTVAGYFRDNVTLSLGAGYTPVAEWSDGYPFVATKESVVGVTLFPGVVGSPSDWTGDVPTLIRNALVWSAGAPPPPPGNWSLLATDPDEGNGTSLKAIYGQLYSDVIYFKVEHYRPWTIFTDIDTGILIDADQNASTGLPDGFYSGQNTSIGADYLIIVGFEGTSMWWWDPIAGFWNLSNPIPLAYIDAPSNSSVYVAGVYQTDVITAGALDIAVADIPSAWDWMPDTGHFTLNLFGVCYDYTLSTWITPPATGDWVVNTVVECNSTVITQNGNLTIDGSLSFNNVTLRMNSTVMGQYGIEVNNMGAFYINSKDGAPSVITNGDNATAYYTFQVKTGSTFEMRNSELYNAGFAWNLPNYNWAGLWINTDNTIIDNNLISNNHFIGILLYNSDNHTITNNIIRNNDWDGIWGSNSHGNLIQNNEIFSNGDDGISLSSASGTVINLNKVYSNGDHGIVVSSGTIITNNNASSNGDDGISVSSSANSLLSNNTANNNGDNGIVVSSSQNSNIIDNTANGNGNNGIDVQSSDFSTISGNTANDNGDNGIDVHSSDFSTVTDNTANYNGDDGIVVTSSLNPIITNNTANYNFVDVDIGTGIVVNSSPNALVHNNTANSNWRGIYLTSSSHSTITLNEVNSNTWYGIHLYLSPTSTLQDNVVSSTTGEWDSAGVYLSDSEEGTLTYNEIYSNLNGMILWNSPGATIANNEVNSNTQKGISLQFSGDATIMNNNAKSNGDGISLSSSDYVVIDNNNATSNGDGIVLSSSDYVKITNNNASNNGKGIYLGGSHYNIITYNHVESNTYGIYLTSSSNNVIANNTAEDNNFGLSLWWSSNNNNVENNDFDSSVSYGAYVFSSNYNNLTANDLRNSGSVGIHLEESNYNQLSYNNATESQNYGIDLFESDWNEVAYNDVRFSNDVGIGLSSSDYNNIHDNIADGSSIGISLRWSNGNTITNNIASLDNIGISLLQSNNNAIINNTASSNNNIGIELSISSYNDIIDNTADDNANYGIHLYSSDHNNVINNDVNSNGVGIYLDWSPNNVIRGNIVNFNSLTGIAVYWESNNNQIVENNVNSNYNISIRISFSHYNNVSYNEASYGVVGIYLDWSEYNQIVSNTANSSTHGISLEWFSNNNQIINNKVLTNLVGISLEFSTNNTITGNNANLNEIGVSLEWSSDNNILTDNTANLNTIGISLYRSNYNQITQNEMLNNTDYDAKVVNSDYNSITFNVACIIYSDTITNTITGNTCPYNPYISIYADSTAYTTGDNMDVGLNVTNPVGDMLVNIYIWLDLPDGGKYWVVNTSVTLPAGLTYSNPTFMSFTLPPITAGQYAWHAQIQDPATSKIISESIWPWTFSSMATESSGMKTFELERTSAKTNFAKTRIGIFHSPPVIFSSTEINGLKELNARAPTRGKSPRGFTERQF